MKLLAIETSANACSAAILLGNELHVKHEIVPLKQASLILPMIDELMRSVDLSIADLDALAFGCGPGSFTGVRIAASVIQGLAYASQKPIIQISSLAACAQAAYEGLGWKKLLVAMDARIHEVYYGAYEVDRLGLVKLVGTEMVCPPTVVILPSESDWFGVGSAWAVYQDSLPYQPLAQDSNYLPTAAGVALLAKGKFLQKDFVALNDALPVYLRDEVAIKEKR